MKKNLSILAVMLMASSLVGITGCGEQTGSEQPSTEDKYAGLEGTALDVAKASDMTLAELEAASKAEMEASTDTFKVVGLTSTLSKAMTKFAEKYEWIVSEDEAKENTALKVNTYCNNSYKDYALLTALDAAYDSYFADFALVQDARSLADYLEAGVTHNYVPSDYKEMGLSEADTYPLKGIHFNKIFYTHKDYEQVTGRKIYNIWQFAGSAADGKDHVDKFSFQSPVTEQINMSFLLSCYAKDNQARIEEAYKEYYKKDWSSDKYASAGEQLVAEMVKNVTTWHSSDGTSMKETVVTAKDTVFYGAFAKMKDAAGKDYDTDGDGTKETNAMTVVDWDLDIKGFNGFMYTMYSQIVNNAKHPYTACLYARNLLLPDSYKAMCYNSSTPNKAGEKANMYGYYYPCKSDTVGINDNDWTKEVWIEKSINEDYNYLKTIKTAQVNAILALVNS